MGEKTAHVQAEFEHYPGEAFYGLGAHQSGLMSYAGRDVDMYQLNTVDIVPFLVSSRGLRAAVGQHVAHEVRRSPRAPCTFHRRTSTTPRASRAASPAPTARATARRGTVVAHARRSADRLRRAGGSAGDLRDPQRGPGREPALHPKLAQGEACVVWDGEIEFEAARQLRPSDVREQRRPPVARRAPGRSAPGGRAGCPGGTAPGSRSARRRSATSFASNGIATRARARCG